jgi:hypothetical protein
MEPNTQRVTARSGARRAVAGGLLALVLVLAFSASAFADTPVSIRIEARTGTVVPSSTISLGTTPVTPDAAHPDETCPGNSVIGALDTATHGAWKGTWSDSNGWSIDSVTGIDGTSGKRWVVYLDEAYLNTPPCQKTLNNGDRLIIYPLCDPGMTAFCWSGGPMLFNPAVPSAQYPGASLTIQAWQLDTTFDSGGIGTTTATRSVGATVDWVDGETQTTNAPTDPVAGEAVVAPFTTRGDSVVTLSKGNHVPDHAPVCVSDGQDGYCGSTIPPANPFDPLKFCTTTGDDGYCGSPDHVPPVGHITQPLQGHVFPKTGRPRLMKGTVDFDPSQVDHVDIRLMRQTTITTYKLKKKRVTVKKKVHGRTVRKRVTKKVRVPVKKQGCQGWNVATSEWRLLKRCDASLAGKFRADGADVWQYEFLQALPPGSYTLDALAVDGAGNVDQAPEIGRNRVTFKVN